MSVSQESAPAFTNESLKPGKPCSWDSGSQHCEAPSNTNTPTFLWVLQVDQLLKISHFGLDCHMCTKMFKVSKNK